MSVLDDLNQAQAKAAQIMRGPVLIIAGPGTGKTKTLTAHIVHLIQSGEAKPEQILALTFTKKAAEEMRNRVQAMLAKFGVPSDERAASFDGGNSTGAEPEGDDRDLRLGRHRPARERFPAAKEGLSHPKIATFHALCHELLGGEFEFVPEPLRLQIIKKLSKPPELKTLPTREVALLISRAKNLAHESPELAKLTKAYDDALAEQNLIDFDDLLVRTRELLEQDESKRAAVQKAYTHILVDEFQDTNLLQYELLKLMRGTDNLFVIGDPNQSIYGFRGASGGIFEEFTCDFPNASVVPLQVNYRSAPEVVRMANHIFAEAPDLAPHAEASGRVRAVRVLNEYSEANWVLAEVQKAIGGGDMLKAVSDDDRAVHRTLADFAVLYRNRSAAKTFQKVLADSGLPYQVVGDGSPYDQPQVQALLALLRSAHTGKEPQLEGYSAAEIRAIHQMLQDAPQASPAAAAEQLVGKLGFEPDANLQQFLNSLVRFADLPAALKYFDDIAEQGFYDPAADAITLLTIHASKGLEFSHVFLLGAEEGILPHTKADTSEEKRLFYVAVTRAKHNLDVLHATHRGGQAAAPSRFVEALGPHIIPKTTDPNLAADIRRVQQRAAKRSQQSLF
jgi:DNA helicase II / ATP-dependent DNA helicase PcrA